MNQGTFPYIELDTPAILINLDRLEANIKEMSDLADAAGVKLRPHTKVHQAAEIAKMQIEAGAGGIEVGNVGQAESMAEEGIEDIVIAHPFSGTHKLEILKRLLIEKRAKLIVVVDMVFMPMSQAPGQQKKILIKWLSTLPLLCAMPRTC